MLCGWGGECMPVLFKKDFMMYCIAWGGGYASAFNDDFMLYCIVCGGGGGGGSAMPVLFNKGCLAVL